MHFIFEIEILVETDFFLTFFFPRTCKISLNTQMCILETKRMITADNNIIHKANISFDNALTWKYISSKAACHIFFTKGHIAALIFFIIIIFYAEVSTEINEDFCWKKSMAQYDPNKVVNFMVI